MASGTTHFIHNSVVAAGTTAFAFYAGLPILPVILANAVSLLVTPDIDMETKTHSEVLLARGLAKVATGFSGTKKNLQKVERFFAALIMSVTAPYAFLFPHRSWLTHLPPFSVIVQLLYFYGVYFCFCKVFNIEFYSLTPYIQNLGLLKTEFNIIFFAILNIQHLTHLIGDGGMILFFGKHYFIFTKPFYNLSRKLFPQSKRD